MMTTPPRDARTTTASGPATESDPGRSAPPVASAGEARDWVALTPEELPIADVYAWALHPAAGAVVLFSGTVRDHAEHRTGVTQLVYEAYDSEVAPRLADIAAEMRRRWPSMCKAALLHRVGALALTESSVVVAVSAPHRVAAFEAARFGIDTLKATVPIWKQEHHDAGTDWGLQSQPIAEVPGA